MTRKPARGKREREKEREQEREREREKREKDRERRDDLQLMFMLHDCVFDVTHMQARGKMERTPKRFKCYEHPCL